MVDRPPAGYLKHVANVLKRTNRTGGQGQATERYFVVSKGVRCRKLPRTGRELEILRSTFPAATHVVHLRPLPGLSPSHSFDIDGKVLHIQSVRDLEGEGRLYECVCQEIVLDRRLIEEPEEETDGHSVCGN